MENELKEKLTSTQTWQKGLFILVFAVFYGLTKILVAAIVIFQFISLLITGRVNERLAGFANSLAAYVYQLLQFMLCNSSQKPFPFSDWPESKVLGSTTPAASQKKTSRKKVAKKTAKKEDKESPES